MSDYKLDDQKYTYYTTDDSDLQNTDEDKPKKRPIIGIIIIIVGIILFIVLLALLFAPPTNNTSPNTPNLDTPANIIWRGAFIDKKIVNKLIDEYKKIRPNVTILYENVWNNSNNQRQELVKYQNDLNRILGGSNPLEVPDIFMVKNTWVGDYESRSVPHPTKTRASLQNEGYYEFIAEDFAKNGVVFGIPLWVDTFNIIVNKDLLQQESSINTIPTSLDSFQNFIKSINSNKIKPFAMGTARNVSFAFEFFQILLRTENITFDANEANLTNNFNFTNFKNAFQFFKSFLSSWSTAYNNDAAAFLKGEVIMIFQPSYRLREILRFNDLQNLQITIETAKVPYINQKFNVGDYWGLMVSKTSRYSKAAWDFIDWLSQNSQLQILNEEIKEENGYFGILFPKKELNSNYKEDKLLSTYVDELDSVKSWYQIKGTEIQQEFEKLLNSGSVDSNQVLQLNNEIRKLQQKKGVFSEIKPFNSQ